MTMRPLSRLLYRSITSCSASIKHAPYTRSFTSIHSRRQEDRTVPPAAINETAPFTQSTQQSSPQIEVVNSSEALSTASFSQQQTPAQSRPRVSSAKEANHNFLAGITGDINEQNARTQKLASGHNARLQQAASTRGSIASSLSSLSSSSPWAGIMTVKDPFHLHCFTTKHNTHVTLTNPQREPLISISCGNLGFRKGARGSYESAFQTSAWVMRRMQEKGCFVEENDNYITKLEVVLRGFAEGRQAFIQALMGIEGRLLRPKITKVSDGTRIAIGGPRAPNPRRLG